MAIDERSWNESSGIGSIRLQFKPAGYSYGVENWKFVKSEYPGDLDSDSEYTIT